MHLARALEAIRLFDGFDMSGNPGQLNGPASTTMAVNLSSTREYLLVSVLSRRTRILLPPRLCLRCPEERRMEFGSASIASVTRALSTRDIRAPDTKVLLFILL
jgi:hypothetical protein